MRTLLCSLFVGILLCVMGNSVRVGADEPLTVAHRGLLLHAPENTLSNFRACLELRFGFEFDVERTKDGQLVCIHDSTVERTTNGKGNVADLTLAEIRQLDAGSWFNKQFTGERVPTVDEVLQLVRQYRHYPVLIAVDLKAADVEQEVVRLGQHYGVLNRLLFIGRTISDPQVRQRIKQASAEAQSAAVANTPAEFASALADKDATWVYFRFIPTRMQVTTVHAAQKRAFIAGLTVGGHVPENWRQAIAAKLDAILTDYPLELRQLTAQAAD